MKNFFSVESDFENENSELALLFEKTMIESFENSQQQTIYPAFVFGYHARTHALCKVRKMHRCDHDVRKMKTALQINFF